MEHFRVLLDLDGTVAQNAGRLIAERQYGVATGGENAGQSLMSLLGFDSEQFWAWWHANQEAIYGEAVPISGAREVLAGMKEAGAYIAVVTARRSSAERVTREWLARSGIPYDTMVMDADDKVAVARALSLNVGFEDDPAHAVPLADLLPMALMLNHKNLGQEIDHPQIQRLSTWSEALPWLRRLSTRIA